MGFMGSPGNKGGGNLFFLGGGGGGGGVPFKGYAYVPFAHDAWGSGKSAGSNSRRRADLIICASMPATTVTDLHRFV